MPPRAPKHCSQCMNVAEPGKRNCGECGNDRWPREKGRHKRMRTPEVKSIRQVVMGNAKGLCEIRYVGICRYRATDLDHKIPVAEGGSDLDIENYQAACGPCHDAKSSDEGHRAQGHKVVDRERLSDAK